MINNSSLFRWDRLNKKNIDNQFVNKLISGLNCSPFEATAIMDTVYEVYKPFFENSRSLIPGQQLIEAVSIEDGPGVPLSNCHMITVTITVDAGKEDLDVRKKLGVSGLRLHKIQRICTEVFQQGGLLTVEDMAYKILHCGERTICRDIKLLKNQGITLPLRSTIKDIGRTLSHRLLIVKEWLAGKEYSLISRKTSHSITSVQNYVSKFKRVICLANQNYECHTIAYLVKLSKGLVEEYYKLYKELPIVPHRKEELESLLKKTSEYNQKKLQIC